MAARPPYLGQFEQVVLLAVLQLGDEAYAVPMRRAIEEAAARDVVARLSTGVESMLGRSR